MHASLNYAKCTSRLDKNLSTLLFKMNITLSMKTKVASTSINAIGEKLHECYTVFAAFDLIAKK